MPFFLSELPDLVLNIADLAEFMDSEFIPMHYLACPLEEKCLSKSASLVIKRRELYNRRLLRFTATAENRGLAHFRPRSSPEDWKWHKCHNHYHSMEAFTHYDLSRCYLVALLMRTRLLISNHVIRFSDLVDLWVIKIKGPWSFAHVVHRDLVNGARNAARTCERFVYSIVELTWLYDYQPYMEELLGKFTRLAKVCGLFSWLCWLAGRANSDHMVNMLALA